MNEKETEVNFGIKLTECCGSLAFGSDALLLAAYVRRRANEKKAAEFGAGSGVVSLLCAACKKYEKIDAYELQGKLAETLETNIEKNSASEIVTPHAADIRNISGVEYDSVFTNPPYMKNGNGKSAVSDIRHAARHEQNGGIAEFCSAAGRILRWGGSFYCVYRPDRAADLICAMRASGIEPKRITAVHSDTSHAPSVLLAEGKRGGGASIFYTKPLFINEDGKISADMKYIYETGDFPEHYSKP